MRLLYVTYESPIFPAGGIGTYLANAARAMEAAGVEVYLFTWTYEKAEVHDFTPFEHQRVKILRLNGADVWRKYPTGPYDYAVSNFIRQELAACVRNWRIDVVEATDYLAPVLAFFQDLQSQSGNQDLLCVSYNHGFIEDFYDSDQISPDSITQDQLSSERQQLRTSDVVIVPSLAALRRLEGYDIVDNVQLIREPYEFSSLSSFQKVVPSITYIGRISISKGIDKVVLFANLIDEVVPLESILLIGKTVNTPFRVGDVTEYVSGRLNTRLRSLLVFTGSLPREAALGLLRPGSLSPSLGSAETFSYACVETIDRGLVPVVRRKTAMAEFFPPELNEYLLEHDFRQVKDVQRVTEKLVVDGPVLVRHLQEYNLSVLNPGRIASLMVDCYDSGLRAKRRFSQVTVRKPAGVDDVTILLPIFKPEEIFLQTVDSIAAQSAGMPNVIICDDGTPQASTSWFEYARLRLPRCEWMVQPNAGLLSARNSLAARCDTRLSVFLDADDILSARFLERTLEAYNKSSTHPNAVLTQRLNFGESNEKVLRHFQDDHMHLLRNDYRMTALMETVVLKEIGFDTTRRNGEGDDWVFWLQFASAGYHAAMVPETLFRYRFRTGSMSWPWSMGQASGTHSMIREALVEMVRRRPRHAQLLTRALSAKSNVHV